MQRRPAQWTACLHCRAAKVKCEDGIPCFRCRKIGLASTCKRCPPRKRGRKSKDAGAPSRARGTKRGASARNSNARRVTSTYAHDVQQAAAALYMGLGGAARDFPASSVSAAPYNHKGTKRVKLSPQLLAQHQQQHQQQLQQQQQQQQQQWAQQVHSMSLMGHPGNMLPSHLNILNYMALGANGILGLPAAQASFTSASPAMSLPTTTISSSSMVTPQAPTAPQELTAHEAASELARAPGASQSLAESATGLLATLSHSASFKSLQNRVKKTPTEAKCCNGVYRGKHSMSDRLVRGIAFCIHSMRQMKPGVHASARHGLDKSLSAIGGLVSDNQITSVLADVDVARYTMQWNLEKQVRSFSPIGILALPLHILLTAPGNSSSATLTSSNSPPSSSTGSTESTPTFIPLQTEQKEEDKESGSGRVTLSTSSAFVSRPPSGGAQTSLASTQSLMSSSRLGSDSTECSTALQSQQKLLPWLNPAASKILGYSADELAETMKKAGLDGLLTAASKADLLAKLWPAIAQGHEQLAVSLCVKKRSGALLRCKWTLHIKYSPHEGVPMQVVFFLAPQVHTLSNSVMGTAPVIPASFVPSTTIPTALSGQPSLNSNNNLLSSQSIVSGVTSPPTPSNSSSRSPALSDSSSAVGPALPSVGNSPSVHSMYASMPNGMWTGYTPTQLLAQSALEMGNGGVTTMLGSANGVPMTTLSAPVQYSHPSAMMDQSALLQQLQQMQHMQQMQQQYHQLQPMANVAASRLM